MKKYIIIFTILLIVSANLWSQIGPIANNDYVNARLGDTITVNVIENDIHPEGLAIKVQMAASGLEYTDSTITFLLDYDRHFSAVDTIRFTYLVSDENGLIGPDGQGVVYVALTNDPYFGYLDHNNIRARIQASGLQFWPGPEYSYNLPQFEFPKGSGINTVFNSAMWVGGLDESGSLKLAAERYRQGGVDYWPGPLNNIESANLAADNASVYAYNKVWILTKEEVIYHKQHYNDEGYEPIINVLTWPAHGDENLNQAEYLAPFVDVDGDGMYLPMNGDYPLIRGEQCIYFIINDMRDHTETEGEALGLEIHGMAYVYATDKSIPMDNTLFFNYKIFNRSENTYHDTYVGLFTDFDIGFGFDDYVGCDVARGAYYGYNADSIDGNGEPGTYGSNIPAQGIVILGGPAMDSNDMDDPDGQCDESINGVGFGDGVVDNERYGMRKFIYFNNGNSYAQVDPTVAPEYYSYLEGIWLDGTAMEYGGNGHVNSGAYGPSASFMFPGNSDPCYWGTNGVEPFGPVEWSEITAGNQSGDRRGLSVMGPFTFEPGSMEMVDIAYVAAFPEEDQTAVETLMGYIDEVKTEYYKDPTYFGYQWLGVNEQEVSQGAEQILVYPIPVGNVLSFYVQEEGRGKAYQLADITGKIVMAGRLDQTEIQSLHVAALDKGLYILTVKGSNSVFVAKVLKN